MCVTSSPDSKTPKSFRKSQKIFIPSNETSCETKFEKYVGHLLKGFLAKISIAYVAASWIVGLILHRGDPGDYSPGLSPSPPDTSMRTMRDDRGYWGSEHLSR